MQSSTALPGSGHALTFCIGPFVGLSVCLTGRSIPVSLTSCLFVHVVAVVVGGGCIVRL